MNESVTQYASTLFGYIIGYLLPGLFALITISMWFPNAIEVYKVFETANSTTGIFLLAILFALMLGIELTAFRFVFYDCFLCKLFFKIDDFNNADVKQLADEKQLKAFKYLVDQHYKYHEFWGNVSIVIPVFFCGTLHVKLIAWNTCSFVIYASVMLAIFIVTVFAALNAYHKYVKRTNALFQ